MHRTIFLDVIDPSVPEEAQRAIQEQMEELRNFTELRPSKWKRLMSLFTFVQTTTVGTSSCNDNVLSVVGSAVNVLDVVAVVDCGAGCFCAL